MRVGRFLAYVWALPVTLLGLVVFLLVVFGGQARRVDGVLEVHGRAIAWFLRHCIPFSGGFAAMTLGHIVVGRDPLCLEQTRLHERVHVAQCERWGLLFIPAYLGASLWAWCRGGHYYRDNYFERAARAGATPPEKASRTGQ